LSGAPFVPLAKGKIREALEKGGLCEKDIFYDLGCGDGRALLIAAEKFNVQKAVGWDIAIAPFFIAKMVVAGSKAKDRIEIHLGSLFLADISKATFIYIYLLPVMIDKVADKIAKEAPVGAKIACAAFPFDESIHSRLDLIGSERVGGTAVYFYQKKD
jgi:SAM-dependent methyltransferase